ncbi:DUF2194 domain-containing protein [Anaerobacillus sp. 1_MG-2023]|uniref:DUF2194 domain-containing protein n=1 Tax=Anaerobacillus sp. 1_MG-2023 TaxID=3062655 RepID=UPI0026E3AE98|nr:DUF2194 domain-containing protein [Anaerobacillus sp. 1_MG-2023]MDO6654318.1 DUF2194 domain-containing protein [Anaerobacillus sp. 1_MG-2023]
MKKQSYQYVIAIFVLLLIFIGGLQMLRLDLFQQLLPAKESKEVSYATMSSSSNELKGEKMKIYIHEDDSDLSKSVLSNLQHALDYAKVAYEPISIDEIPSIEASPYNVLVLAGEHSKDWPYEEIKSFVEDGGRLYIGSRFINAEWNELLGVTDFGDFMDGYNGLSFKKELFPGYIDLDSSSTLFAHSIADVELKKTSEVFIKVEDEPILWTHEFGKGKILFWNTTSVAEKISRGLLLQAMSFLTPAFVSSQAGIKVVYLDDFPSPVPYETTDTIQNKYDMTIKEFYTNVWWQDMKQLAEDYNVLYTGVIIGTYRDTTEQTSEDLNERIRYPMLNFGRDILKHDGELGLHGYNHQSLVLDNEPIDPKLGYSPWESQEEMTVGIKRIKSSFDYFFPKEQIKSYVPPSNIINKTGIAALVESLPHLEVIAALYSGTDQDGSYIQEFGQDESYDRLYNFPRISSGYLESEEDQFIQIDAIANFGMVSHFVHPDDVLDPARSTGDGWEGMKTNLEAMLKKTNDFYPYLEPLTQHNGLLKYKKYEEASIDVTYEEDYIHVSGEDLLNPSTMLIRVQQGKRIETGSFPYGEVSLLSKEGSLYQLTLTKPEADLLIKDVTS